MPWLIIAILAAIYLVIRFIQIGQFIFARFFFNPAIPIPVKFVTIVLVVLAVWGFHKWWRWYFKRPGPSPGSG